MAQATSVPSSTVARACRPWNGAATAGVDSAWDCGPCGAVMRPPCGLMAFSNSERPSRSLKRYLPAKVASGDIWLGEVETGRNARYRTALRGHASRQCACGNLHKWSC
jgi:hypothetical protein